MCAQPTRTRTYTHSFRCPLCVQKYSTAQVYHAALQSRYRAQAYDPTGKAPDLLEHSMYATARNALNKACNSKERWVYEH
jgi:hypothetical protein